MCILSALSGQLPSFIDSGCCKSSFSNICCWLSFPEKWGTSIICVQFVCLTFSKTKPRCVHQSTIVFILWSPTFAILSCKRKACRYQLLSERLFPFSVSRTASPIVFLLAAMHPLLHLAADCYFLPGISNQTYRIIRCCCFCCYLSLLSAQRITDSIF